VSAASKMIDTEVEFLVVIRILTPNRIMSAKKDKKLFFHEYIPHL